MHFLAYTDMPQCPSLLSHLPLGPLFLLHLSPCTLCPEHEYTVFFPKPGPMCHCFLQIQPVCDAVLSLFRVSQKTQRPSQTPADRTEHCIRCAFVLPGTGGNQEQGHFLLHSADQKTRWVKQDISKLSSISNVYIFFIIGCVLRCHSYLSAAWSLEFF